MNKFLLTLGLVSLATLTNAQVNFKPAANYTTNGYTFGVTTANFNADNHPDIAIVNRGTNDVSILLNTGTGTFTTAVNYTVGSVPVGVAAADFNNDGSVDFATCNNTDNNVAVLFNTGTGTFNAPLTYTVGNSPTSIATADFNGDTKADIVVVNNLSSTISILLNTGTGTFNTAVTYTAGNQPYHVSIADFNADASPDIAVSSFGNNKVVVLLNTGNGTFSPQAIYAAGIQPYGITTGDFTGDGAPDIAVTNINGSSLIYVLPNTGAGIFGTAVSYTVGGQPYDVAAADFDTDGNLDIVAANYNDNNVSVLINTGTGSFKPQVTFSAEINPTALSTADFNGDGRADIVTANSNSGSASVINSLIPAAALNFDGVNDYVSSSVFSTLTGNITIEAAVNWNGATGANQVIMVNGNTTTSGYAIFIDHGNSNNLSVLLGGVTIMSSTVQLTTGTWHMVSVVNNNSTWSLYIDGISYPLANNISSPNPISGGFVIGSNAAGTENFNGSIDEVRFWRRAVCQPEIQNNLHGELSLPQNGLIAYYNFNQGVNADDNTAITTLTDVSGNSHNAQLNNFTLTGTTSNWVAPGAVTTGSNVATFTNTLSAVATQTNLACFNNESGVASVNVSGVGSPYTYVWSSGGSTTNTATNLSAGNYTCTINNSCGTIAQTFTITQPTVLAASSSAGTILCNGGVTTVTVTATDGTAPYTNDGTFTNVTAGSYTYTVTDHNSCTSTTTITVTQPAAISPNLIIHNVTCFDASNGSASLSLTGGTPAYTYTWLPSGGNNTSATDLISGTYTCTITDANACPSSATVTITQPNAITTAQSPTLCLGSHINVGPHTYSTTGTYTDVLTAANGCDSTVTTNLTINHVKANFTSEYITCGCGGVGLADSSYASSGDNITSWHWTFASSGGAIYATSTLHTPNDVSIIHGDNLVCLKVTTQNGCTDSICKTVIQYYETINQLQNPATLSIYPNPAQNNFTIETNLTEKQTLDVYDVNGKLVYTQTINSTTNINAATLAPGVYNVSLTNNYGVINKRLIIIK